MMDAALHRFGLPTTGASGDGSENLLLQIAPLVIALGWSPPDPQQALELLTLPASPVPPSIAQRLRDALHEWPAVDNDSWRDAIAQGLAAIEDEKRRDAARLRLDVLFNSPVQRGGR